MSFNEGSFTPGQSSGGSGAVSSVSDSGASTTTISPTTGAVKVSVNLGNANAWTAAQTFPTSGILLYNPAGTHTYTFLGSAITANRIMTLPLITGTDTIAVLGLAQTFTAAQTMAGIVNTGGYTEEVTPTSGTSHSYTVAAGDTVLALTTGSASDLTVDLPAATGSGRKLLLIKVDSGTNHVVATPNGSDHIEANTTVTISSQYGKLGLLDAVSGVWSDLGSGGV